MNCFTWQGRRTAWRTGFTRRSTAGSMGILVLTLAPAFASSQTITVVGTPHFRTLEPIVEPSHVAPAVEVLGRFEPTQVCIEAMSGDVIEDLLRYPDRYGALVRTYAGTAARIGVEQQLVWETRPTEARATARALARSGDVLDAAGRVRLIGLQLAGYDLPSAVLNWTYLDVDEREAARAVLGIASVEALEHAATSRDNRMGEIYSLAVPLAREAGLRELCSVDSFVDELGAQELAEEDPELLSVIAEERFQGRLAELVETGAAAWSPQSEGARALVAALAFYNSADFAALDLRTQWDLLYEANTEKGAGRRRLMLWHARTSFLSVGLFRALAQGPDERVMLIVGAAHRSFLEALLESQPYLTVVRSANLF